MTYLNEYHKAMTEQSLAEMTRWRKRSIDWQQQTKHILALSAEAEHLYPRSIGRN